VKINFHRVLLGFFENWDKSPQKKWDKGGEKMGLWRKGKFGIILSSCPNCVQLTKWPLTTLQAHKM
jgi:hypothetical protein